MVRRIIVVSSFLDPAKLGATQTAAGLFVDRRRVERFSD
jgi:hypothetical protein